MKPGRISDLHDEGDLPGGLGWSEDDRRKCRACGEFARLDATACAYCHMPLVGANDLPSTGRARRSGRPLGTTWEIMMFLAAFGLLSWLARIDGTLCAGAALALLPWIVTTSLVLRTRSSGPAQDRRDLSFAQQCLRSVGLLGFPAVLFLLATAGFASDPALSATQVILALVAAAGSVVLALVEKIP